MVIRIEMKTMYCTDGSESGISPARSSSTKEKIYLLTPSEYTVTDIPEWPAAYERTEEDFRIFIERCQPLFSRDQWSDFQQKKQLWLVLDENGSDYYFTESMDVKALNSGRAADLTFIWLRDNRIKGCRDNNGIHVREGKHRAYVAQKYGYTIPVAVTE